MKGEGHCAKAPDDSAHAPYHCVHVRVRKRDCICCWCGDLFHLDELPSGPHGQYRPRAERRRG